LTTPIKDYKVFKISSVTPNEFCSHTDGCVMAIKFNAKREHNIIKL